MTAARVCRWCSEPLSPRKDRGRPSAYCNVECRRASEYRVRTLRKMAAAEAMTIAIFDGVMTSEAMRRAMQSRLVLLDVEAEIAHLGSHRRRWDFSTRQ